MRLARQPPTSESQRLFRLKRELSGPNAQEDRREAHGDFDRTGGRRAAGLPCLGCFVRRRKAWDKQLARRSAAATTRPPRPSMRNLSNRGGITSTRAPVGRGSRKVLFGLCSQPRCGVRSPDIARWTLVRVTLTSLAQLSTFFLFDVCEQRRAGAGGNAVDGASEQPHAAALLPPARRGGATASAKT